MGSVGRYESVRDVLMVVDTRDGKDSVASALMPIGIIIV